MAGPGKRIVYISEDIFDIVPQYLEARHAEVAVIRAAAEAGDFPQLSSIGHKLKGVAASYGFPELSRIGEQLEEAAARSDASQVRRLAEKIAAILAEVEIQPERAA